MTIGERIKWARQHGPAATVTRQSLADSAGLKYSTLADLENSLSASTTKLHAIAKRLRVRVEWLETGKGDPEDAATSAGSDQSELRELQNRVDHLSLALAAILTISAEHRPVEYKRIADAMKGQLPDMHSNEALRDALQSLDKAKEPDATPSASARAKSRNR